VEDIGARIDVCVGRKDSKIFKGALADQLVDK
jgi:hypothetical protein